MTKLYVSEIFYSIEGEGAMVGTPTHFLRLKGCPIKCEFCDTKYAWVGDKNSEMSEAQIVSALQALPFSRRLSITGGEPVAQADALSQLLWGTAPDIYRATKRCTFRKYQSLNFELSGHLWNEDIWTFFHGHEFSEQDMVTISPKMGSAKPGIPYTPFALADLCRTVFLCKTDVQMKINFSSLSDLEEAWMLLRLLDQNLPDEGRIPVYFIPAVDPKENTYRVVSELKRVLNTFQTGKLVPNFYHFQVRLGIQLHKLIWGGQMKGV